MLWETYDTGKASGDDSKTTKVSWLKRSVLTGASLTVIPVTDDNPRDSSRLVVTGSVGHRVEFLGLEVLNAVGFAVGSINSTDKHVVGNVVKMSTVLQPRASHY
jgi:hypothetical protein